MPPFLDKIISTTISFLKKILQIIKGYLRTLRNWLGMGDLTRSDKWAVAFCVLFAFSIWLYVMNTGDTTYENSIKNVVVAIEGREGISSGNMSIISGYSDVVTVTLKGKRSDIGNLSAGDIRAYVDVSEITQPGLYPLSVKVVLPSDALLVSIEPSSVSVDVDKNADQSVRIDVKLNYAADASFTVGEPELNFNTVTVTGPRSVLDEIKYAAAVFNPGVITTSLTLSGSIALYNEYNQIIDNPFIKMSVTDIIVRVPVTMRKTVPVTVTFLSGVSSNYHVSITPAEITLVGDPQLLADIHEVSVFTINNDLMVVGKPINMNVGTIDSLPSGVTWENSEHGIAVNIERLY